MKEASIRKIKSPIKTLKEAEALPEGEEKIETTEEGKEKKQYATMDEYLADEGIRSQRQLLYTY